MKKEGHQSLILPKINNSFYRYDQNPFHLTQNCNIHDKTNKIRQQKQLKFKKQKSLKIWEKQNQPNGITLKELKILQNSILQNQTQQNKQEESLLKNIKKNNQSIKCFNFQNKSKMIQRHKGNLIKQFCLNEKLNKLNNLTNLSYDNFLRLNQRISNSEQNEKNVANFMKQQMEEGKKVLKKLSKVHIEFLKQNQLLKRKEQNKKILNQQVGLLKQKVGILEKYKIFIDQLTNQIKNEKKSFLKKQNNLQQIVITKNESDCQSLFNFEQPDRLLQLYQKLQEENFILIQQIQRRSLQIQVQKNKMKKISQALMIDQNKLKSQRQSLLKHINQVENQIKYLKSSKIINHSKIQQQLQINILAVADKKNDSKENAIDVLKELQDLIYQELKTIEICEQQNPQFMQEAFQIFILNYRQNKRIQQKNMQTNRSTQKIKKIQQRIVRKGRKIMQKCFFQRQQKKVYQPQQKSQQSDILKYFT